MPRFFSKIKRIERSIRDNAKKARVIGPNRIGFGLGRFAIFRVLPETQGCRLGREKLDSADEKFPARFGSCS
jgi:hypothetical protein